MSLFGSITRSISRAAKSVAREAVDVVEVVATPVTAVATAAVDVATGERVDKALGRAVKRRVEGLEKQAKLLSRVAKPLAAVPVVGTVIGQAAKVQELTFDAGVGNVARTARDVASGVRIDKAVGRAAKRQVAAVDQLVPYVQTALSFIPGPGQGLSAAIGAAHALAHGRPITEAFLAAVQSALPGGAVAQAAFGAAVAAAQGKPIDQIAINALPLSQSQKAAIEQAATVAKQVAMGKPVDRALYDNAVQYLQSNVGEAVQAGMAMGQAKVLQTAKTFAPAAVTDQIQQAADQVGRARAQVTAYAKPVTDTIRAVKAVRQQVQNLGAPDGVPWLPVGWSDHLPKGHG